MKATNSKKVIVESNTSDIFNLISSNALPLEDEKDLDPLIESIGDSKYVLLGEASHGTHEYYSWRMKITQRLIKEKNFSFIGVEGDWPDCYRVNRFAKNYPQTEKNSQDVLKKFNRWPTWMWGNWEMVAFIDWLKSYNSKLPNNKKIGFYGLDVYSFRESMDAIMNYLKNYDTVALNKAKQVIKCFEPFGEDEGQSYARASALVPRLCEQEVVNLLTDIRSKIPYYNSDAENVFSTEQNAHVAVNAEKYYRAMIKGGPESWNIRDKHMVSTIERLIKYHGNNSKIIIWEHNTHIGDARATDMEKDGLLNVGQLLKEQYAEDGVFAVGFGSYQGSVIAGKSWGDEIKKINVPEAKAGSWEEIFHKASNEKNKLLIMDKTNNKNCLKKPLNHRAIGVVYNPQYEQFGNYVPSIMNERYDAFIFIDKTKALYPLHIEPDGEQIPETYPFGV